MMRKLRGLIWLLTSTATVVCTNADNKALKQKSYPDLIVSVKITPKRLEVELNSELKPTYFKNDFFAIYDDEEIDLTKLDSSIALLPFLLNVVTVVWISGRTYQIDTMDEDIYYSLTKIKKVFERLYPKTSWDGNIVPKKLIKNRVDNLQDPEKNIALLYSAGLDSTSSAIFHADKKQLLITAWGQWDVPLSNPDLWKKRKKSFIEFALKYGHANAFVKSNYASFLNHEVLQGISKEIVAWREDANEGIGMIGLAAPLMVTKKVTRLLIASSYTWNYPYPTAANPLVDDNVCFAQDFRGKHDQFDYSRLDKLAFIAEQARLKRIEIPRMKVCNGRTSYNCCDKCSKCLQTIMALIALGEDHRLYGFDISREKALARTEKYLHQDLDYWVRWNFLCIQRYLKKQDELAQLPDDLRWFLDVPLHKHLAFMHTKYKKRVKWNQFKDLAPADLMIHDVEPLRLAE